MPRPLPQRARGWIPWVLAVTVLLITGCTSHSAVKTTDPWATPSSSAPVVHLFQTEQPSGHITWDFSQVPPAALTTVKRVAAGSEAFYRKQFGAPWHNQRISIVQRPSEGANDDTAGEYDAPATSCQQAEPATSIRLSSFEVHEVQLTLPHEIAHAFVGCTIDPGRFAEGQAEAFAQVYRHHADPSNDLPEYIGLDQTHYNQANRPGTGVSSGPFQSLQSLDAWRYIMLASALRLYDKTHPGFLKRQYLALYKETQRLDLAGGIDNVFTMADPLAFTARTDPTFATWLPKQHIFDAPPHRNLLMTVAFDNHISLVAIKYGWNQQPWAGLHVTITVKGLEGFKFTCVTNAAGTCPNVDTDISLNWITQLYPRLKAATITVTGGGLTDTRTYPILEP